MIKDIYTKFATSNIIFMAAALKLAITTAYDTLKIIGIFFESKNLLIFLHKSDKFIFKPNKFCIHEFIWPYAIEITKKS